MAPAQKLHRMVTVMLVLELELFLVLVLALSGMVVWRRIFFTQLNFQATWRITVPMQLMVGLVCNQRFRS
jgi:hypothetical protein